MQRKAIEVFELDFIIVVIAQITTLSKKLSKINVNYIQTNVVCDYCE
jgi:hypothetical protein